MKEGRALRAERAKRRELIVQWLGNAKAGDIPLKGCVAKVEVGAGCSLVAPVTW